MRSNFLRIHAQGFYELLYMGQPLKLDYVWAALCMLGAVYFVFRT